MFPRGNLSRRDAFLVLFGACFMHILSFLFPSRQLTSQSTAMVMINQPALAASVSPTNAHTETQTPSTGVVSEPTAAAYPSSPTHITHSDALPPTTILAHAPGWTLFQNLYMSNGTLFLIIPNSSYTPSTSARDSYGTTKVDGLFPEIRMMTSTGLMALNTPDNIAQRETTEREMRFVLEAAGMWGKKGEEKRVWTVDGNTLLFNDPPQFLRHYYHFIAELFLGVQAFWHGFFSSPTSHNPKSSSKSLTHTHASTNTSRHIHTLRRKRMARRPRV